MCSYNFSKLIEEMKTDLDAIHFLQTYEIIPSAKTCMNGHSMRISKRRNIYCWVCQKRQCRSSISVRRNTWLERMNLSYTKILLFLYSWTREVTTIKFCSEEFIMSSSTTVTYNHLIREVCAKSISQENATIGGPGMTVEIDETCFSKYKCKKSKLFKEQWIFGGICRESKEIFLYALPDREVETLIDCIEKKIKPGTTIVTNCLSENIEEIEAYNFEHLTFNHSENIQNIESMWRILKDKKEKLCGINRTMLDSYFCEFIWRQKYADKNLFVQILNDIANFHKENEISVRVK